MKFNIKNIYVIIGICLFFLLCYNIKNELKLSNEIVVNATPITNKVIVIDAGHGIPDEG